MNAEFRFKYGDLDTVLDIVLDTALELKIGQFISEKIEGLKTSIISVGRSEVCAMGVCKLEISIF